MLNSETSGALPLKSDTRRGPFCHSHCDAAADAPVRAGAQRKKQEARGAGRAWPDIMCAGAGTGGPKAQETSAKL